MVHFFESCTCNVSWRAVTINPKMSNTKSQYFCYTVYYFLLQKLSNSNIVLCKRVSDSETTYRYEPSSVHMYDVIPSRAQNVLLTARWSVRKQVEECLLHGQECHWQGVSIPSPSCETCVQESRSVQSCITSPLYRATPKPNRPSNNIIMSFVYPFNVHSIHSHTTPRKTVQQVVRKSAHDKKAKRSHKY